MKGRFPWVLALPGLLVVMATASAAQADVAATSPAAGAANAGVQKAYADADNLAQAVGMMETTRYLVPRILQECAANAPASKPSMQADVDAWMRADAGVLTVSRQLWTRITRGHDAQVEAMRSQWLAMTTQIFESIRQTDPDGSRGAMGSFCQGYFRDLASGVWRTRTPRAYAFLEAVRKK